MLKIKNGKTKAFNELYNRYSKKILNFFYKKLNYDEEKANDFLQNIFLKIIENPQLFKSPNNFKSWFYTIANNMCKNEYRVIANNKIVNLNNEQLSSFHHSNNLTNDIDLKLFNDYLNIELDKLSDLQKETFVLRHKDLLTIKEISYVMNCSIGTVKSRLFYSSKILEKNLSIFNRYE